jgi:CYTH domain-containing protein
MNYQTVFERTFLMEKLPETLTRASEHLQFFDNYIENTRLCLRTIRVPKTNEYTYILEQKFAADEKDLSVWNVSQIYLNEAEHEAFEQFEGREIMQNERAETNEIRFNRYFYDYQNKRVEIDVYLGKEIWGLILGRISFETFGEMQDFELPVFAALEVTNNPFFTGQNLIGKTFADVQRQVRNVQKISYNNFLSPTETNNIA